MGPCDKWKCGSLVQKLLRMSRRRQQSVGASQGCLLKVHTHEARPGFILAGPSGRRWPGGLDKATQVDSDVSVWFHFISFPQLEV